MGRRVALRPLRQSDYDFVYDLYARAEHTFLWRFRGALPGPEVFMQMLWQSVMCQFVIVRTSSGEPLGVISAYNVDHRNGYGYLALVLEANSIGSPVAHDANLLFLNYLFTGWPLRKLYGETTERHIESIFPNAVGKYVRIEGTLRNHDYYDGRYWDAHITALYREDWEPLIAERLPRIL